MNEIELINKLNSALDTALETIKELNKLGYKAYITEVSRFNTRKLGIDAGINELADIFNCSNPNIQLLQDDNYETNYHCRSIKVNGLEVYQLGHINNETNRVEYEEREESNEE